MRVQGSKKLETYMTGLNGNTSPDAYKQKKDDMDFTFWDDLTPMQRRYGENYEVKR